MAALGPLKLAATRKTREARIPRFNGAPFFGSEGIYSSLKSSAERAARGKEFAAHNGNAWPSYRGLPSLHRKNLHTASNVTGEEILPIVRKELHTPPQEQFS